MKRQVIVCALLLAVSIPAGVFAQTADTEFEIEAENSIETPDRTVTVDGNEYQVTSIGRVQAGESITIATTAPSGTEYNLYLYDSERQIVTTESAIGESSWTIDSTNYEPGSYVVAIYGPDGQYKAVQPIVFAGYAAGLTVSETITQGTEATITVETEAIADTDAISAVEVVIANDTLTRRIDATDSDEGAYSATVEMTLPTGAYQVYATVRGEDGYGNRAEILGVSDSESIQVIAATETPDDGGSGGEGGNGDPSDDETATPTLSPTPTVTTPSPITESPTTTLSQIDQTPTTESTDRVTTNDVVTPAASTSPSTSTSSWFLGNVGWMLLFGLLVVLGILAVGIWSR